MDNSAVSTTAAPALDITAAVKDILATIEREREREIVARRFGLYERRETLEQIGELLGITRERVRQLEKAIMIRLKLAAQHDLPHIEQLEKAIVRHLYDMGHVARISDVTPLITSGNTERDRAHIAFISEIAPRLAVVEETDNYHHSVGLAERHDPAQITAHVDAIVRTVRDHGSPITVDELHARLNHDHPAQVHALAGLSKHLAHLKGKWGLAKWPMVNPKNIRDKIYVILDERGKPMHFNAIADSIKKSDFKRKDVTTQAIHNELIKDSRFVLIGRGIYALREWGFKKGTVADIIYDVLREAGQPLHRDEIVRRVLKHRQVKETTILLNLQGKGDRFHRVAKATYSIKPEVG